MICEAAHSGSIGFFSSGFRIWSSQSTHACVRVHIQKDEPIFNIAIFQSSGNFFSTLFFKVSNQDTPTFSHIPARCSTPDDWLLQYRPWMHNPSCFSEEGGGFSAHVIWSRSSCDKIGIHYAAGTTATSPPPFLLRSHLSRYSQPDVIPEVK